MSSVETNMYGKHPAQVEAESGDGYESPEEYADQGDTRVVRNLIFTYLAEVKDVAGISSLMPVNLPEGTEVTVDQIGLKALKDGEEAHSFYTSEELEAAKGGGGEAPAAAGDVSAMGEYELVDWLKAPSEDTGRPPSINDVLAKVGTDKELAHRMLQAENIRSDGDPRAGLEAGLEEIIKGD